MFFQLQHYLCPLREKINSWTFVALSWSCPDVHLILCFQALFNTCSRCSPVVKLSFQFPFHFCKQPVTVIFHKKSFPK